ncbi:hypothetical protein [Nocardia pseudobrasiliensis]|uniref:PPE family protein n=1 Tax=Nocardia pseudobrasiliensis TaxID=45979 RepID=A0A370I113_9NOCA|nr:hypothetical protein [Nocardia pseudobrasiliensis]RDI64438.1 hypothetical protein DFR76_108271 [Nocardia pseudobrasiliensis]
MTISNEPSQIGQGENPDHLEHWAIYRAFNPQHTTEGDNAAGKYARMAATWDSDVTEFAARIRRSSAAAWSGPAAESSREAINNYAQRALDLTPALQALSQTVSTAVTGINNTKSNVDEPNNTVGWHFWNTDGWGSGPRSRKSIDAARDRARAAMRNYYLADFKAADAEIPVLPQPVSPTNPLYKTDSDRPIGKGIEDDGGGGTPNNPSDVDNKDKDKQDSKSPDDTTNKKDSTQNSPEDSSSTESATNPAAANSDSGSAAPTDPNALATKPTGVGTGGSGSGGYPGGGLGGLPGGSTSGVGANAPGSSMPGAATPGTAANPTAAGRAGAAGQPGMGMPEMGGGKGKSEDDERAHTTPDWLKNMDNTEELLGPAPKTIPGGVIGGEYADPEPPNQ